MWTTTSRLERLSVYLERHAFDEDSVDLYAGVEGYVDHHFDRLGVYLERHAFDEASVDNIAETDSLVTLPDAPAVGDGPS